MGNSQPKRGKDSSGQHAASNNPPPHQQQQQQQSAPLMSALPHLESLPVQPIVPLTEAQKAIILETWKLLEQDIANVGIIVFIK